MSKIKKLTQEQIEKLSEYKDKWIKIGLSTDPANREEAEIAINESYINGGLKPPKKIVWCGSPFSQGLVRAIILDKNLIKNIGYSVWDSVWNSVRNSVWDSVWNSVWDSVWNSVRNSVSDSVWNSVSNSVRNSVWDSVWNSVRNSVSDSVRNSVSNSVNNSVSNSVNNSVSNSVWNSVMDSVYGQHDASWLSFYEYFYNVLGLTNETKKLSGLWRLSKSSGWILPNKNICFASERHYILNRDENGAIHSLSDAAIMYPDGWAIYAIHGVRVPERIIKNPSSIKVKEIEKENNAEIRRVMIDQYDRDCKGRYLKDSGAKIISKDNDQYGRERILYIKELNNDEPIVMVSVINSTPEPDGSYKNYFLRVPPSIKTPSEAIAWTFGKNEKEYNPEIET